MTMFSYSADSLDFNETPNALFTQGRHFWTQQVKLSRDQMKMYNNRLRMTLFQRDLWRMTLSVKFLMTVLISDTR